MSLTSREPNPLRAVTTIFLASALLMFLLYGVLTPRGHLIYAWPLTGVQLALLLARGRASRGRAAEILASAGGSFLVVVALGMPLSHALVPSACEALELWIFLRVLAGDIHCFDDLKKRANVFRFLLAAIAVPLLSSLDAPLILPSARPWRAVLSIALSDSLGIAVFAPALLLLLSRFSRNRAPLLPSPLGIASRRLLPSSCFLARPRRSSART